MTPVSLELRWKVAAILSKLVFCISIYKLHNCETSVMNGASSLLRKFSRPFGFELKQISFDFEFFL